MNQLKRVNAIDTSVLLKVKDYGATIVGLTTIAALNVVDNKKPDVSNLVQKANYVAKYKIVSLNILPHLIIINLQMIHLMQRQKIKK